MVECLAIEINVHIKGILTMYGGFMELLFARAHFYCNLPLTFSSENHLYTWISVAMSLS